MNKNEYLKKLEVFNYTVYMHKNKINGKVYIGITCQQPVKRRWRNGSCYKKCPKFNNAIQKYGWNNFEHIILFEHLTKEEACLKEIELIKKYNSIENGYNISKGGEINNEGCHFTLEHKRKIGQANLGIKNGMYGKTHNKKTREIISNNTKKMWNNNEYREKMINIVKYKKNHFRKIICLDTNEIFFSISEACRKYNLQHSNIIKCCNGERKKCGNLHWRYYEE